MKHPQLNKHLYEYKRNNRAITETIFEGNGKEADNANMLTYYIENNIHRQPIIGITNNANIKQHSTVYTTLYQCNSRKLNKAKNLSKCRYSPGIKAFQNW